MLTVPAVALGWSSRPTRRSQYAWLALCTAALIAAGYVVWWHATGQEHGWL